MSLMESVPTLFPDDWPRVRATDPITSHQAADSNNVSKSHRLLMQILVHAERGVAQFEAEQGLAGHFSPSRVRSAFSELEALGKVERTDEYRTTPSGRRAQVWRLS